MGKQSREKQIRRDDLGVKNEERKNDYQTGLEKTCIFIIRWATYLSLFIPLFIPLQFFFPFVAPKTILFRILAEIIFTAYLFLVIHNRSYRPRISLLTISLTVFLVVLILASFAGINFNRSFWSTYERMTGIFTMLHLYAFFIVLVSVFKKREDWQKFLGASIIAGVLLGLYVLSGNELSTRGGGTIGNTSFMAAYLLFNVFFAIILLLAKSIPWKIFSGISLLIMLPVFLGSTARGAIASFFLGLFLLFLGYLIFSKKKILQGAAFALILLIVLSSASLFVFKTEMVKDEMRATLVDMNSRFVVWEDGLKGFLERPVLGWGPENFNSAFLKNYNSCMSLPECGNEVWFDRVHNIIFDTLVAAGIAGLLSYLAIFLAAIYGLLKIIPKITKTRDIFFPLGLIVVLITYFFQNLLVFDMINSYLLFFLTLAFIGFLVKDKEADESAERRIRPLNPFLASVIAVFMIFIFWAGNVKPMMANYNIIKAVGSGDIQEFTSFFRKSLDSWMNKYEAREQYVQKLVRSSGQLTDLSAEQKKNFSAAYELGEAEMEKSIRENYLDFRHHLFAAELYLASFRTLGGPERINRAEEILNKAIELSPANQQGYWQMAEVKVAQRRVDEAIVFLKKAIDLEPRMGRAYWYLAMAYRISGDYRAVIEEAKKAEENGYNWLDDQNSVQIIAGVLNELGENPTKFLNANDVKLVSYYSRLVEADPQDYISWSGLATAYANLGQYDKVREAVKKLIEIKPDLASDVEEFLKSLPK